jgi:hypothetical protein
MATFDINDVARRVQYTSTGQTGPFSFTFQVNASSELLVYIDDTAKTETTHYTVSLNADGTGSVTFTTATTSGELITIIGDQPLSRTTVFQVGQVNQPTTLETEFDNTLIRQQQIKEITDRSIQLKPSTGRTVTGSGTSGPLYFPYDTTVANNANRILKYDSNGTSLELGSTSTNIDALAAIASDITTVSGISGNVTTVAGIASNVTSVASNASNITTVATNIANVNTVAGISSNVTTVAGLSTEITALSGVSSQDLIDVAALGTELQTLAPIASDITTVAGVSGNVTTVAGISSDVSTVSGISANTTTVAGISGNVTTVAGISSDVSTVAGISANVTTVAGDTANIGTVAGNTTNINTVATNITDVNTFANRYRISATDPTTSLDIGDLYYDTTNDIMKVYGSSGWQNAGSSVNGTSARFQYSVSSSTTTITGTDDNGNTLLYDAGYVDVYLNGIKMVNGSDVTVTSGSSVVFATAIGTSGTDTVDIIAYGTFNVAAIDATSITSGTLGYSRGGTGLGALGSADEVLQMNAGGTALEYGKVDTANIADDAVTSAKILDNNVGAAELNVSGNGTSGQVLSSDGDGTFSWADASDPLAYTSVSGTTPSLDVGTYNFFDSGTLTGDTTVSFSNIPTQARWTYTAQAVVTSSFDISALSFDTGQTFTETIGINSYDIEFSSDGLYMYMHDYATSIYRYPLSTAWDLTTASSYDQNPGFSTNTSAFVNYKFGDSGTKLYLAQNSTPISIDQYNLSTAWSLTSATYNSSFSVTSQISSTNYPFALKSDGTKFYNGVSNTIYQYSMSTPWSISTSSYDSKSLDLSTGVGLSIGVTLSIDFNDDGTKLFASGGAASDGNHYIYEYSLSTAWDISTGSYTSRTEISPTLTNSAYGIKFKPNGDSLFIAEYPRSVHRYTTGNITSLTLPTTVNAPTESLGAKKGFYEFFTSDGGSNIYLLDEKVIG